MELVDIYNNKHEKLNYSKGKKELLEGEYRLSCFIWIINDKKEILIQQRLATAKKCPNMWETTSGGAIKGDSALSGAKRELIEELGIKADNKDIMFIGSYARTNDFVEVFLLKSNINIKDLSLQNDEVQDAKWVTISEFEKLIRENKASDTGYIIFKNYLDNYYNKVLEFVNGKPILIEKS